MMMKNPIKTLPIWLIVGLTLTGCGADTGTAVSSQSSYSTTSSYSDYYSNTNGSGSTSYTTDGSTGTYAPYDSTLPITDTATSSQVAKSGVEAEVLGTELPGILMWERCEAQIRVTNHEATSQQGYLLVSFTLKDREVELQYRVLSLAAGATQTFKMTSSVRADGVKLDYRTKLL